MSDFFSVFSFVQCAVESYVTNEKKSSFQAFFSFFHSYLFFCPFFSSSPLPSSNSFPSCVASPSQPASTTSTASLPIRLPHPPLRFLLIPTYIHTVTSPSFVLQTTDRAEDTRVLKKMTPTKSATSHTATAPIGNPNVLWSVHGNLNYPQTNEQANKQTNNPHKRQIHTHTYTCSLMQKEQGGGGGGGGSRLVKNAIIGIKKKKKKTDHTTFLLILFFLKRASICVVCSGEGYQQGARRHR